jgi:hypothetical protein
MAQRRVLVIALAEATLEGIADLMPTWLELLGQPAPSRAAS